METLKKLLRRMGMLVHREKFDADLDEEIRLHMELREKEKRSEGMNAEEARYAAQRQFGNATRLKEVSREAWGWTWLEHLMKDFHFGLRMMRMNRGFTAAAVLSLALGIGANTAIFQLLNSLRMRELPVKNPQELVEIKTTNDLDGASGGFTSWNPQTTYFQFDYLRKQMLPFNGLLALNDTTFNLSNGGEARNTRGLMVSGSFFSTLQVQPHMGRFFTEADDQPGCGNPGVVISYPFWQKEFGGEASAIGKKISLDSVPGQIVGITPPNFYGVEVGRQFDVAVPLCMEDALSGDRSRLKGRAQWWLTIMARVKPGTPLSQVNAQLAAVSPGLFEATLPSGYNETDRKAYLAFRFGVYPAATGISDLRRRFEKSLWLLLGIAGLVLAIACTNLANLMLARANAREREIAVRMALGASRWRLVRQLLSESFLLAATGAMLGLLLAQNLSQLMITLVGTETNRWYVDLQMDWRVLGFTAGLSLLTCFLFGLTPAIRATRCGPGESLKSGGRSVTGGRDRFALRRALVVTQVALSLVLVVGAMLFTRSFQKLITDDAGFRQDGLLVAGVDFHALKMPPDRRVEFRHSLLEKVRAIPGLQAASTTIVPLRGSGWNNFVWPDGKPYEQRSLVWMSRISDGYFSTMGIPILAGRDFETRDSLTAPKVAIVTEAFARRLFNGANPVGQRIRMETDRADIHRVVEIVGMVRDMKYRAVRDDRSPIMFFPASQEEEGSFPGDDLMIRSTLPLGKVSSQITRVLREMDPLISVEYSVFQTLVRQKLLQDRLMATLSSFFGVLAAALAAIGLYGVIAYMVERRRSEIGIRMALGADRQAVLRLVFGEAGVLVALGAAIGTLLALAAGRTASSLLFGLQPYDAISMSLAVAELAAVALAASFLPAYKASRMDPVSALRQE